MALFVDVTRRSSVLKYRDITIHKLNQDESLVILCDSYGGIGNLPMDQVQVSPETVGYYTALLCLKECASIGAKPLCLVNLVSASFEPTGKGILAGIEKALEEAGIHDLPINGSSEENFAALQTGGGMTLLATLPGQFQAPKIQAGDEIYLLGEPSVGDQVIANQDRLLTLGLIRDFVQRDACIELVPLGSGGITTERERYCASGLSVDWLDTADAFDRSAGPATAALMVYRGSVKETEDAIPIRKIGRVES